MNEICVKCILPRASEEIHATRDYSCRKSDLGLAQNKKKNNKRSPLRGSCPETATHLQLPLSYIFLLSSNVKSARYIAVSHPLFPISIHQLAGLHNVCRTTDTRCLPAESFLRLGQTGRRTRFLEAHQSFLSPRTFLFLPSPSWAIGIKLIEQASKVTVLGGSGGIGQPLSLLMKLNPRVTELALYDIRGAPGWRVSSLLW